MIRKLKEIVQELFFSSSLEPKAAKVSDSYTVFRHSASTEIRATYIPKYLWGPSH